MDILNSGSFVPLDNREKIEHLIFTAKTLATETCKAAGFRNSGLTNQQLALEMWKGAEYMCRAHEEATVRNLFLSNFLQKLNEVVRETATVAKPTSMAPPPSETFPESKTQMPKAPSVEAEQSVVPIKQDEFIGVVPLADIVEEKAVSSSYADECKPEYEDEIVEMTNGPVENLIENLIEPEQEINTTENSEVSVAIEDSEPESEITEIKDLNVEIHPEYVGEKPPQLHSVQSIALAENEPFNFDSCTITAVVQLLPVNEGFRKCVVSVRSHDFLPQITIHELVSGQITYEVKQLLESSLATYRSDLPALAADKIKKEAQSKKKRTNKSSDVSTTVKMATTTSADSSSDPFKPSNDGPTSEQAAEPAKDQQTLFAQ